MESHSLPNRTYYVDSWSKAFTAILRWDLDQFNSWLVWWDEHLDSGLLYHENPMYYVANEIVGVLAPEIAGPSRVRLVRELQSAIEGGDINLERNPQFDWSAARNRVARVLNEHGIALPS